MEIDLVVHQLVFLSDLNASENLERYFAKLGSELYSVWTSGGLLNISESKIAHIAKSSVQGKSPKMKDLSPRKSDNVFKSFFAKSITSSLECRPVP